MSKTVDTPQDCSVCDNKTTLACSKCQTTFFCSTECQRPMWASHQYTCGKPESSFTVPPLSLDEFIFLLALPDTKFMDISVQPCVPKTLLQMVQDLGLYKGTHEDLVVGLAESNTRLLEPFLSPCLFIARAFAHAHNTPRSLSENHELLPLSSMAWNVLSYRSVGLVTQHLKANPVKATTTNPFGLLTPVLRQELVVTTLLASGAQHYLDTRLLHPAEVALQRLLQILRKTYSSIRDHMKLMVMGVVEFYEEELGELQTRSRRTADAT